MMMFFSTGRDFSDMWFFWKRLFFEIFLLFSNTSEFSDLREFSGKTFLVENLFDFLISFFWIQVSLIRFLIAQKTHRRPFFFRQQFWVSSSQYLQKLGSICSFLIMFIAVLAAAEKVWLIYQKWKSFCLELISKIIGKE